MTPSGKYDVTPRADGMTASPEHGTRRGFKVFDCRCQECRAFINEDTNARRRRNEAASKGGTDTT